MYVLTTVRWGRCAYADSGGWFKPIKLLEELVLEVRRLLDALFQLLEGRPRHVADSDVVRGDGLCGNQRPRDATPGVARTGTANDLVHPKFDFHTMALENQYRATS